MPEVVSDTQFVCESCSHLLSSWEDPVAFTTLGRVKMYSGLERVPAIASEKCIF